MGYKLIVNKSEKNWPERHIKGKQILELAGSPPDWVVNQLVPGSGERSRDRIGAVNRPRPSGPSPTM
jgi:hypothetical protein